MAVKATDNTELHVNIEAKELWTEGNLDVLREYYTDDFVYHGPDGESLDLAEYEAQVREFLTAFPSAVVDVHETILDGDTTAATFTYRGTWDGAFRGMEPNGATFATDGISMARIEEGKFAEIWRKTNNVGMLAQLGIVQMPE